MAQIKNEKINWKGIILAGGSGTRLFPLTKSVSKQLLPVFDKPMIYYPLSALLLAKIRDILIITTPEDQAQFMKLLGDGSDFGVNLSYAIQPLPNGLAEAFIIGSEFIGDDNVCLVLGDNIFFGQGFKVFLEKAKSRKNGATIFGYPVSNPENFGVVDFDENNQALSVTEKPQNPSSNYAVTGLYFYDNKVVDIAKQIRPSDRGELEITTINNHYLNAGELRVENFGRGFAWLDTGTHNSLMEASQFIQVIERRQGLKVACLEELAYRNSWITKSMLKSQAKKLKNTSYGEYLAEISNEIK